MSVTRSAMWFRSTPWNVGGAAFGCAGVVSWAIAAAPGNAAAAASAERRPMSARRDSVPRWKSSTRCSTYSRHGGSSDLPRLMVTDGISVPAPVTTRTASGDRPPPAHADASGPGTRPMTSGYRKPGGIAMHLPAAPAVLGLLLALAGSSPADTTKEIA